jgi:hypothetical protein
MKKIEITHAEVIPHYGTTIAVKEIPIKDKGTIISFNVKTRIDDRKSNSPVIFDKCSYFTNSSEQVERAKQILQLGNIIDIKGKQQRNSSKDKAGVLKYYDSVDVREITPVQAGSTEANAQPDDDLPF